MADDPDPHPKEGVIPLSDTLQAPFIFYEKAPAFVFADGVINVTLSAHRTLVGKDGVVTTEQVVVAYLRGTVPAALSLRQAIDKALLLAAPTQEGKAN